MIKWNFTVDKPLFLILPGHSVQGLIDRWDEVKDYDCLWVGMNRSTWLETFMDRPLDILIYYCTHCNCELYKHKQVLNVSGRRGNSLLEFINQCNENDVNDLVLFGADGYSDNNAQFIYGDDGGVTHKSDCEAFNSSLPNPLNVNILNVSLNSHYTALKRVSYEEFLTDNAYKKKSRKAD